MELFDLYTHEREKTGLVHRRGEPMPKGYSRLVVHIAVFNSRGELLIQHRHPEKKVYPALWDISAGGCAVAGETSRIAAERELHEELGIRHSFRDTPPVLTVYFEEGFDDYYVLVADPDPATLRLQAEEVTEARFATLDEIMDLHRRGLFIPYREKLLELLFDAAPLGHVHIVD